MPTTLIEVRRPLTQQAETDIMEAVHRALIEAFKIPMDDRCVRLIAHEPHRFACPPDRDHPELYTHISLDVFAGRSLDAKRALYRAIVENLEPLGIPRDHVKVVVRESPRENWGDSGGRAGSDVDLGFEVEV
jgi:5-carboxymethyl-2-hydroxymuconate isomerase